MSETPQVVRRRLAVNPGRSSGQDAEATGCAPVDGECVCDRSGPRNAEADAHGGGVMPDLVTTKKTYR